MAWQDRLSTWVDSQIARVPVLDRWFENHFHAIGMHGPEVRHLLKTRFVPVAMMVTAAFVVLAVVGLVRRARASRPEPAGAPR
jgi:hypothetical protein